MAEMVTSENLNTLVYTADVGTQYRLTDNCVRTMGVPFIEIDEQVSELMAKEKPLSIEVGKETYSPQVRLKIVKLVTSGDDVPEKGIDLRMINRIVADFFTFRIAKAGPQTSL